ncbi:polymer-forming cytoskeletal protein [Rapidithrix thailandica]|uniref:Polymer-forming cytoskeletal protein n=1 Tax=Rapidithrix thailandica TaxID=413964 RepID=A0AAW9S299_9BACT
MSIFGKQAEKEEEVQMSNSSNIIGKGTIITGDIETFGNIRIDGKLNGNVKSKSKVAIGKSSVIVGNIISQNAEIEGEVNGKLEISDVLVLHPTAQINGDIYTGKLVIQSGAKFNGNCKMGEKSVNDLKVDKKGETKQAAKVAN